MVHAYVLAETRPGAVVKVSELVAEIPGVTSTEIITGPYASRISLLKTCMQDIFQSGVAVVLIE